MEIKTEELAIKVLNKKHNLSGFESYEGGLVEFLHEDALENQRRKLSVTFLGFYQMRLVCYLTLLADKINLEGELKHYFKEKDIHYCSIPSLKVGRLCVHDAFLRKGIGKSMIEFAFLVANVMCRRMAGCRLLTVDAKGNGSIDFYKKLGFRILRKKKRQTIPMWLDLDSSNQN